MNVTTRPTELANKFGPGRTESLIETDSEQGETAAEETTDANETEVEIKRDDDDEDGDENGVENDEKPENEDETAPSGDEKPEEPKKPEMVDQSTQILIEKRNVRTGTECELVRHSNVSVLKLGIPALIESIKAAFIQGGSDPRSWDQGTLDDTPVAHFGDILYIQVWAPFFWKVRLRAQNFFCKKHNNFTKIINTENS